MKSTWQQHWYEYDYSWNPKGPHKAVDGLFSDRSPYTGQCTVSGHYKRTATWGVDLEKVLNIHHITIYYRTDNLPWDSTNGFTARFLGFSLFISNTTKKNDGYLCFKDTNYTRGTIPNNITIECIRHGRYVIFYNERLAGVTYPEGYSPYAYNDLCEVEVYGCPSSVIYGANCSVSCPKNCHEGRCNIEDGTCVGCVAGHKGSRCEQLCDSGKFGLNCDQSCGFCLRKEQCHHLNGTCLNGCDRGYQGDNCTQVCPEGQYGYNCLDMCNINCREWKRCDRKTGQCYNGCQAGWKEMRCDKKCDRGTFGLNCAQSCGVCLDREHCHHINGTCLNGCDRGYQGDTCTQECPDGHFGHNCQENCSSCPFLKTCDAISGQCSAEEKQTFSDLEEI
ncbi:multiple epidermal growth factor-like domains protein 10 [Saccostrea echinata]|uniref:multiple epidermal growth factor-like domains protein 10 n=1 Tax=Saccostrea echinata TaxID=191078 RepID=UPI002A808F99|nr:multiple epidermal growth factor-like domains protein 10 [Saccostrea echinata]